jgi:hypothetical protein
VYRDDIWNPLSENDGFIRRRMSTARLVTLESPFLAEVENVPRWRLRTVKSAGEALLRKLVWPPSCLESAEVVPLNSPSIGDRFSCDEIQFNNEASCIRRVEK